MFFDLGTLDQALVPQFKAAGFQGVALNEIIEGSKQPDLKSDSSSLKEIIEKCLEVDLPVMKRVTYVVSDISQWNAFKRNKSTNNYDILSAMTQDEKTFQLICKEADVDLITFDLSQKLPFTLKRTTMNLAIQRNIYFEINYSAVLNPLTRKNAIIHIRNIVRATRGRNLIISSGHPKPYDIRTPQDLLSLSCLFELNASQSKQTIRENSLALLKRAYDRKYVYKSTIQFIPNQEADEPPKKKQKTNQ